MTGFRFPASLLESELPCPCCAGRIATLKPQHERAAGIDGRSEVGGGRNTIFLAGL
jgi:hypothetical protein